MGALARIDDLLAAVRAAGATIRRDGDFLDIEAPAPLPENLLARLREAKPDILSALADAPEPCTESKRQVAFEAAMSRWLNMNPAPSDPAAGCAWCGKPETPDAVVVPFGIGPHVWLHHACWPAWCASRRAEAVSALAATGIPAPPVTSD